jgi:hypothetical protein
MGLMLNISIYLHDFMVVWKNKSKLILLTKKIPKLASFISHFDERRFFSNFELLLKHSLSFRLRCCHIAIQFNNLIDVNFDLHRVYVIPNLSSVTGHRNLPSPIILLLIFRLLAICEVIRVLLSQNDDLLVNLGFHHIGYKLVPIVLFDKLFRLRIFLLSGLLSRF